MWQRFVSVIVLWAFLNYTLGCTKLHEVYKGERLGPTEKIIAVVLPSGSTIKFNSKGGRYESMFEAIVGVTTQRESLRLPIGEIDEIRSTRPQAVSPNELEGRKIVEVISKDFSIVKFDDNGGSYDKTQGFVVGKKARGGSFKIELNKLRELRVTKADVIPRSQLASSRSRHIAEIVSQDQTVYTFDDKGGRYEPVSRHIAGITEGGEPVTIGVEDILYVRVKRADVGMSIVATLGVLALAFLTAVVIVAATKESCPFVYSFNGEDYVFDAEPLGGAICRGLSKTDYSRLDHLQPVEGKYHLLLRNEVEETQHLDEMKLVVIDHEMNTEIVPDLAGNMHTIAAPVAPLAAIDEKGADLTKFVQAQDEIFWQTHLPARPAFRPQNLRHELTFEFPKPAGVKSARLIVNLGTALWGSHMIREMLQLRGDKVDTWYEAVNRGGPELLELFQFIEREELYVLKLNVKEGDTWVQRGAIPGAGPLITEDKIVPLDLSGVSGDKLTLRLNPPMSFWTIDYLAVEYGGHPAAGMKEITLAQAHDQQNNDVTALLQTKDDRAYVMSQVGDWAKISFDVHPQQPGTKRTIFLKTFGYYEIHLDKQQPQKSELIRQLSATPGMIVEYALDEYLKWRSQQLHLN